MNFDKMLEYQQIDKELIELEESATKSEERKRFILAKNKVEEATQEIGKLKSEAEALLAAYTGMKKKLEDLNEELDGFDGILEEVQDVSEAEHYLKLVGTISEQIATLEREAASAAVRIDKLSEAYKKTWNVGVKASEAYKQAKADFDAMMAGVRPTVESIQAKLRALQPDIPPQMLRAYEALRKAKKTPAFVAYDPDPKNPRYGYCTRCAMELPNDAKAKLRNPGDYAECPDCHRILYVPQK